jgi:ParB family chromosome partitioning protein
MRPAKRAADIGDQERERARLERRDVIESNKAWRSAEAVRRIWLREFVTRKKPPAGPNFSPRRA